MLIEQTTGGFIGGPKATWEPWQYTERLAPAEKVEKSKKMKKRLKDPMSKQNKLRQEFVPL